ncbi:MAG: DNA-binding response regulator [Betaproteobacteria bacterium]|nr:DNA-binding response regulator [Betaproteobacteria bacterium]
MATLGHVFLVDDDHDIRLHLGNLLRQLNYSVSDFPSAQDFLRSATKVSPSVLLLDMRMPGMNGSEAFDQLREQAPDCVMPVIFLTAHGDVPLVTRVLTLGATDFIQKPASAETLLEKIRGYFAISQARRQNMQKLQDILERIASLTGRERAVMNLLYEGLANKDIAEKLGNSVRTIELRRAAVYDKLRVHSAIELARLLQGIDWSG